jgi:clavulanate-9-aldehyde reducatase
MATADLEGRAVAITGASSGIGEATAVAMARAGASVALGARRENRIDELARRIEDDGGTAVAVATDVGREDEARAFVEGSHERLGRVDVLVNNAGLMLLGPVEGADTDEWRRMIDVNVLGLLYCTHAALPLMREQGGGHIVNVSSVAGRVAGAGSAVYNFTKFGVHGFSEGLRQEALHANVRVTTIAPGFVDTELQGHNENPAVVEGIEKSQARIGQLLRSEDIAEAILYAVSQPEHVDINEILVRPTGQRR